MADDFDLGYDDDSRRQGRRDGGRSSRRRAHQDGYQDSQGSYSGYYDPNYQQQGGGNHQGTYGSGTGYSGGSGQGGGTGHGGGVYGGGTGNVYGGGNTHGSNTYGGNTHGRDSYGRDTQSRDGYGADSYGGDSYGGDSYGRDNYSGGTYGGDSYGRDGYGRDNYSGGTYGGDSYGSDTYGGGYADYDEYDRPRRRRASTGTRKKKKKGRNRVPMQLIITLSVVGLLGVCGFFGFQQFFGTAADYKGAGNDEIVEVEVRPGMTHEQLSKILHDLGVVKSEDAYMAAAIKNDNSDSLQPGVYKLRKEMKAELALIALLDLKNRIVKGLLIKEGLITVEIYKLLSERLGIPVEKFAEAAKDPVALGVPEDWFVRKDGKTGAKSIEGFLFPATYEFPPGVTAEAALKMMVTKFLEVADALKFKELVAQGNSKMTPYQGLIAASIAEAEFQRPEDMAKGVRALYNRVYTNLNGGSHALELDAAVNYYFKVTGGLGKDPDDFKESEIHNPNNPYNTHDVAGWPINPLSNPGENAMKAVLEAPEGQWVFWVVVNKDGTTAFAETYAQHQANIQLSCQNQVLTC